MIEAWAIMDRGRENDTPVIQKDNPHRAIKSWQDTRK